MGALEGAPIEAATQQLQQGDMSSPQWRPPRGTDGTPNESSEDVLIRGRQVRPLQQGQGSSLWAQLNLSCSGCPQGSPEVDPLCVWPLGLQISGMFPCAGAFHL